MCGYTKSTFIEFFSSPHRPQATYFVAAPFEKTSINIDFNLSGKQCSFSKLHFFRILVHCAHRREYYLGAYLFLVIFYNIYISRTSWVCIHAWQFTIRNKALHVKGISWDVHDTLGGQTIATQVFKNGVTKVASSRDSSAFVLQSDLLATNGVIHVIDNVI